MSEVVIRIPGTPDKRLSVNAARRTHYLTKSKISRDARQEARYAVLDTPLRYCAGARFSGPLVVSECVMWGKGERSVDLDSIASMCKPLLDGITDSGCVWLDDRQITELTVRQGRDPDLVGYVEIRVREIAA